MASLVLVAGAQAAVTTSSITSPSDPFYGLDHGQTQSVTISGTSNGTSGDQVDILCYQDNGSTSSAHFTVTSGVAVQSGGAFSTSVPISDFDNYNVNPCRLRAVPGGTTPTSGLGSYSGPRVAQAILDTSYMSTAGLYDFYFYDPQLAAGSDPLSFGDCGLDDSYLYDQTVFGHQDTAGFYCNDYVNTTAQSNNSRSGLEVDGHPAYAPDMANDSHPGWQPITINSVTRNSSNGDTTLVETEPIVRCILDSEYSSCPTYVSAGVQLKRTITQTDDGHIQYFRDAWSSTDGATHSVNLLLENDQYFGGSGSLLAYEFPGQSTFTAYGTGASVSVPAKAPASIFVENPSSPDGSTSTGRGAITYAQTPSGPFAFGSVNSCCSDFDAPNTVSVPASGSVGIGYAYSTEFTLAAVQKDALVAQDSFAPPSLKITKPRNHSKVKSSVKSISVKGTASAGSGVKSVTVNGHKVKVSGGKFSTTVRLHTGRNTITVKLTSEAGKTVTKKVTVTRAKPAAKKKAKKKTTSPVFTG